MKKRMVLLTMILSLGCMAVPTTVLASDASQTTTDEEMVVDPEETEWYGGISIIGMGDPYSEYLYGPGEDGKGAPIPNTWYNPKSGESDELYNWYYSDEIGKIVKNDWVQSGNKWYYMEHDGRMALYSWIKTGDNWYYCDETGVMQTGWTLPYLGYQWYYLNDYGAMQTGWILDNGNWYYCNEIGVMQIGWVSYCGNWYYCNDYGRMQTGWIQDRGTWYYCDNYGRMQTGWIQDGGKWYYLKSNGAMACKETLKIDGKRYSFNKSGAWYK